jgi:hypothetical protein
MGLRPSYQGEITISKGVSNLKNGFAYLKLLESSKVSKQAWLSNLAGYPAAKLFLTAQGPSNPDCLELP